MKQILTAILAIIAFATVAEAGAGADPCLDCHEKKTPGIVQYWKKSAHFEKQVACVSCHGNDIEANHRGTIVVDASKCGTCHKTALAEHRRSKHGIALTAGRACTRNQKETGERQKTCAQCHKPGSAEPLVTMECAMFLAQSPEMQRRGCASCHQVETRCDTCHTKHGTDLGNALDPGACGTCHMGPDHPQMEMWETSRHGVLFKLNGKEGAPSCTTCHMRSGSHDISRGISSSLPKEDGKRKQEREFMLEICSECHTTAFAARNLNDADKIQEQSMALVAEAGDIIISLQQDGLLSPPPSDRPDHPLFGKTFVLGPHMLYENLSLVESLFFKMKSFYAVTAYKGVFHQNPDYAHWYGNAPLKLTLSDIRSEAALLRMVDRLGKRIDNLAPSNKSEQGEFREIKEELRALQEKRLKNEITDEGYQTLKNVILDKKGLK